MVYCVRLIVVNIIHMENRQLVYIEIPCYKRSRIRIFIIDLANLANKTVVHRRFYDRTRKYALNECSYEHGKSIIFRYVSEERVSFGLRVYITITDGSQRERGAIDILTHIKICVKQSMHVTQFLVADF